MPFSSWISVKNSKTMPLQIIHPGGHVELHDRPVTAAEIMRRYPRSCVTYPHVFQQPWAIVEPNEELVLGEKYYVVPMSGIRKLQGLSPRSSPSAHKITTNSSVDKIRNTQSSKEREEDGMFSTCCVFKNKSIAKKPNNYKQHSINNCFSSLFKGGMTKATVGVVTKEIRTSSNRAHPTLARKGTQDLTGKGSRSSPKKVWSSSDNWQPSLESITEE
ncbi:unnamed protein product [Sphenostylis stenocarpa]|uniref:Uncharacterized protein n=1 Tax=Sphenostylis stenocarpa TaxID=92480 RepID=A0AA86SDY6_9FABA|nr:unnamed protein product [Sphenostylis stenocarpa]